jgi:hypothetical protein
LLDALDVDLVLGRCLQERIQVPFANRGRFAQPIGAQDIVLVVGDHEQVRRDRNRGGGVAAACMLDDGGLGEARLRAGQQGEDRCRERDATRHAHLPRPAGLRRSRDRRRASGLDARVAGDGFLQFKVAQPRSPTTFVAFV